MIIWFTGLSGSGKSTLSDYLKKAFEASGFSVCQVDGDIFRQKEKKENKFSKKDIIENNYKIISHCKSIEQDYDFVIVSVISPYKETRKEGRRVFGDKYFEIFLDCPLDILIKNDVKKLYEKAKKGEIKNLIGFSLDSPYEKPDNADLIITTDKISIGDSLKLILNKLEEKYGVKL